MSYRLVKYKEVQEELNKMSPDELKTYIKNYEKYVMEVYPFDECLEEIARGNFYHVNDTDPEKVFSGEITTSIMYHMEDLNNTNKVLKSKVLRLLAYLTTFTKMCEKCCYPKNVCQCKKGE